ncbi:hypothetical protein TNCV_1848161 [Trichonephila clavipes]|nr:hypothetical protein TNCV_1848161 [Trichonephila clavipes]
MDIYFLCLPNWIGAVPKGPSINPGEGVDICKCTMPVTLEDTLNPGSPPDGATAYQLMHRSINRQVASMVVKNDVYLALTPTFRYVSIQLPL